jgi:hypothetical protein
MVLTYDVEEGSRRRIKYLPKIFSDLTIKTDFFVGLKKNRTEPKPKSFEGIRRQKTEERSGLMFSIDYSFYTLIYY